MIRWLIRADMPQIMNIVQSNYPQHLAWGEEDFKEVLRQKSTIGVVFEQDNKVLGFMIYELSKSKFSILQIGVHVDHRMKGIGDRLIERLIDKTRAVSVNPKAKATNHRYRIEIDVPEDLLGVQLFLKKQGFLAKRVQRGQFGELDGIWFVHEVPLDDRLPPAEESELLPVE